MQVAEYQLGRKYLIEQEDSSAAAPIVAELWQSENAHQAEQTARLFASSYTALDTSARRMGIDAVEMADRLRAGGLADVTEALTAFSSMVWDDCRLPQDMRKDLEAVYQSLVVPAIRTIKGELGTGGKPIPHLSKLV